MCRVALAPDYVPVVFRESSALSRINLLIHNPSSALALLQLRPFLFIGIIQQNPVNPCEHRGHDEAVESVVQAPSAVPVSVRTLGGENEQDRNTKREL